MLHVHFNISISNTINRWHREDGAVVSEQMKPNCLVMAENVRGDCLMEEISKQHVYSL